MTTISSTGIETPGPPARTSCYQTKTMCMMPLHLFSASQHHDGVLLLLQKLQQKTQDTDFVEWFAWNFGWNYYILIYTHCQASWLWTHSILSLLFMMVWHFLSDSHKVMIAFVMIPSNCCCGELFCNCNRCMLCDLGVGLQHKVRGSKNKSDIQFLSCRHWYSLWCHWGALSPPSEFIRLCLSSWVVNS
jgi:hypothetical protein